MTFPCQVSRADRAIIGVFATSPEIPIGSGPSIEEEPVASQPPAQPVLEIGRYRSHTRLAANAKHSGV